MKFQLNKHSITRVLVLPDIHYPYEDKRTMQAVEQYMREERWDALVYLGDVIDFNCVSDHNKTNLRAIAQQTIAKDYLYINPRLSLHADLVGDRCSIFWLQGNHDQRIERVINANPVFEGHLEVENNINVIKKGIVKFIPYWTTGEGLEIGKALFIHGLYCNDHHAKQHVMNFGTNVFYGHLHDFQQYSKIWNGDNDTIVGQSLGCLCNYRQYYMHGRPNRWQQGFGVFYFNPDGTFNYYTVAIFNHRFIAPNGKEYRG